MKYLSFQQLQAARKVGLRYGERLRSWTSMPASSRIHFKSPKPKLNIWKTIMGGERLKDYEPSALEMLDHYFCLGLTDFEKTLMPEYEFGSKVIVDTGRRQWELVDAEITANGVWVKLTRVNRRGAHSVMWARLVHVHPARESLKEVA